MSINCDQLRLCIIRPTLLEMDMWSESAENLLLGTCAQESAMGTYLKQLKGGPALSIYQIEPSTYSDLFYNYVLYKSDLVRKFKKCFDKKVTNYSFPYPENLVYDLKYATFICRLIYYRVPKKLPNCDDTEGLANYWKTFYNTKLGKGTVEDFMKNYSKYVRSV